MENTNTCPITLYYDGGCPVCSREIGLYQRAAGGDTLQWVDVSAAPAAALGAGLSRDAALARLHLRRADGSLVSGAAAFIGLWRALPGWAWLGRLLDHRPGHQLLEAAYRLFLAARRRWRKA